MTLIPYPYLDRLLRPHRFMFSGLLLAVLLSYASCAVYGDLFLRLYYRTLVVALVLS